MPIDHLKVGLPVGHYTNYTGKWSIGSICQIGGHLHKIGQHTGDTPCVCEIHLVTIDPPPTS